MQKRFIQPVISFEPKILDMEGSFREKSKDSLTVKSRIFDYSEGHNFVKEKFGRRRSCREFFEKKLFFSWKPKNFLKTDLREVVVEKTKNQKCRSNIPHRFFRRL